MTQVNMRLISRSFIIVTVLRFSFLGLTACYIPGNFSSDRDLEQRLLARRGDFTKLALMAEEDLILARIAPEFYKVENNNEDPIWSPTPYLQLERWAVYKKLFFELELRGGLMRIPDHQDVILMISEGPVPEIGLESKGYAYSRRNIEPLADSLDNPRRLERKGRNSVAFKHVEGPWYLYCLLYDN